jgi:tRNA(Ile2)-agmatinylcytidine synthase
MCTTYLASELISEFSECDIIGYPRLVRLNPNIPWKTRGNGAISIRLGRGAGKRFPVAEIQVRNFFGYERGRDIEIHNVEKRVRGIVEKHARFEDVKTNPAFVITRTKPPPGLYWRAVRRVVDLKDIQGFLKANNAIFRGYKNKRGLIGASAAISWRPRDRTYEITAYRERKRWGTKRKVTTASVMEMDRSFQSTFNNYDYENRIIVIAPSSPCPVLFGIRGDEPKDLPCAMDQIKSERKDRWVLFETNQGTDEHLVTKSIAGVSPFESVITSGTVCTAPETIEGGHVIFTISNRCTIDCAAYEPTKEFRQLIRKLASGDRVTVFGGVREAPPTINIEKIRIEHLAKIRVKSENPLCPECGLRMKSYGKNAGFRCRRCKVKVGEEAADFKIVERDITEGFYEVPVCARRHLSKPLKRIRDKEGRS